MSDRIALGKVPTGAVAHSETFEPSHPTYGGTFSLEDHRTIVQKIHGEADYLGWSMTPDPYEQGQPYIVSTFWMPHASPFHRDNLTDETRKHTPVPHA